MSGHDLHSFIGKGFNRPNVASPYKVDYTVPTITLLMWTVYKASCLKSIFEPNNTLLTVRYGQSRSGIPKGTLTPVSSEQWMDVSIERHLASMAIQHISLSIKRLVDSHDDRGTGMPITAPSETVHIDSDIAYTV
jgi:hypothetical protein